MVPLVPRGIMGVQLRSAPPVNTMPIRNWSRSKGSHMGRVESIEGQILELTPEELATLREWFAEYDAEAWDRQFEADVKAGKLDALAERALRDHLARRSTKL